MEERKATIKAVDMAEELQQDAIDCATTVSAECFGRRWAKTSATPTPTSTPSFSLFSSAVAVLSAAPHSR